MKNLRGFRQTQTQGSTFYIYYHPPFLGRVKLKCKIFTPVFGANKKATGRYVAVDDDVRCLKKLNNSVVACRLPERLQIYHIVV